MKIEAEVEVEGGCDLRTAMMELTCCRSRRISGAARGQKVDRRAP